ncbi:DUF2829 domain-containing protein [Citrobacter werkmanii]|uniref:DUF2829 domain-containing protein n=1 Tax=Citrobacter werkmanii TaxID=67827 RepID=UPI0037CAA23D
MKQVLNWPQYQCHEVRQAIEVSEVFTTDDNRVVIISTDPKHDPITVSDEFVLKYNPKPGGVVICHDGGDLSYECEFVFMKNHHELAHLSFGGALAVMRHGGKVRRSGWNGSGLWLELQKPDDNSKMTLPYIYLNYPDNAKTTPGARVPWSPTQTDVLATDWEIIS